MLLRATECRSFEEKELELAHAAECYLTRALMTDVRLDVHLGLHMV